MTVYGIMNIGGTEIMALSLCESCMYFDDCTFDIEEADYCPQYAEVGEYAEEPCQNE